MVPLSEGRRFEDLAVASHLASRKPFKKMTECHHPNRNYPLSDVGVIIVTHNSEHVVKLSLMALSDNTYGSPLTTIVDSGSDSIKYLKRLTQQHCLDLVCQQNIGFSRANNLGLQRHHDAEFVLFLNPDAFVTPHAITKAIQEMTEDSEIGCLTGKLRGYDLEAGAPTSYLDSTGIFRKWYGRWFDRGQGMLDEGQFESSEAVPAICGAFMFCRMSALKDVALPGGAVFDPAFFMYKEDIELSLRLREKGWKLMYVPEIEVYHCRGWNRKRTEVPLALREMSAKNEVLLYLRHPSIYIVWAVVKYLMVKGFKR